MAFTPITGTVKMVVKAHRGNEARVNVLHVKPATYPPAPGDLQTIANKLHDWVQDHYAGVVATEIVFDEVQVTDVGVQNGQQASAPLLNLHGGLSSDVALPGNCTCVTTLNTPRGGRSGRGRFFAFEPTAHEVDAFEAWQAVYVGLMDQAMQNLRAAFNDASLFPLAVASNKLHLSTLVTNSTTHQYVGSQRDRLPGHRRHKKRRVLP